MTETMKTGLRGFALIVLLCVASAVFLFQITSQSRGRLAAEIAVLETLGQRESQLMQRLMVLQPGGRSGVPTLPEEAIWPQDSLSAVERAIQDAVLLAAQQSGLTVISFGGLGGDARCIIPCSTYELELTGGHSEVVAFLGAVEAIRPALSTRQIWMRQLPPDGSTTSAPINLRLTLWALAPQIVTGQTE